MLQFYLLRRSWFMPPKIYNLKQEVNQYGKCYKQSNKVIRVLICLLRNQNFIQDFEATQQSTKDFFTHDSPLSLGKFAKQLCVCEYFGLFKNLCMIFSKLCNPNFFKKHELPLQSKFGRRFKIKIQWLTYPIKIKSIFFPLPPLIWKQLLILNNSI